MKYTGLTIEKVKELQIQYGKNALPEEKEIAAVKIFLSQFSNPLIFLLLFAGLISLWSKKYLDIVFIFLVLLLNSLFGFFQEYKAQKTLTALKRLIKPVADVVRDGQRQKIEAVNLVPGDIAFVSTGDKIPADGIILETVSFFVNEAILTGESEALEKKLDQEIFMGTTVAGGRAVIQVTKIGLATEMGKIAQALKETSQPLTTLQSRLKKFTQSIVYLSIILSLLVLAAGFLTGQDFLQTLQIATVVMIAIIPEALIIVVTLILVIAMQKTLKRKALIRKLLAVETLGSVTVICTDKTGTLTEGKMKVSETDFSDQERSFLAMCLCNNLSDPTEIAIWDHLKELSFNPQQVFDQNRRIAEIPFSSNHKFMTVVCSVNNQNLLLVKGAPEILLRMSDLAENEREALLAKMNEWADRGLKILGLTFQTVSETETINIKTLPRLEWGGLIGLWDPPRQEVKDALQVAKQAGIKVKVVTGDYRGTAEKIMEFLNLKPGPDQIMEGLELESLSDQELKTRISKIMLFSRVTPNQKLRIVKTLQELGEIVAMTGDGVNDAPALKRSNIGIVVGEASEVAKETADLILLDSNFKTIISAIEEGRVVFENLKKVIFFMMSNSFAEVVLILGSIVFGWPMPLTIIQILWLHLLCDGPEDIVLGFEPKEREVMAEGPKNINEPVLSRFGIFLVFLISSMSGLFALGLFWFFGLHLKDMILGQTMAFMSISFASILYIFSCRTFRKPFWKYENFWTNKMLFAAVLFSFMLQVAITYLPLTQKLLGIAPLGLIHWGLILSMAAVMIMTIELAKAINNNLRKS